MVAIRDTVRLFWVQVTARTLGSTGITPARSPHRTRLGMLAGCESIYLQVNGPRCGDEDHFCVWM